MKQISEPDSPPPDLVFVAGPDSPAGGTDPFLSQTSLLRCLHRPVIGHDEVCAVTDKQAVLHLKILEHLQLFLQGRRIHHHTIADHTDLSRVENSRGNQVKNILFILDDDGVTCIVSPLIAGHNVETVGDEVNDLAFSLIPPLSADNHYVRHDGKAEEQLIQPDRLLFYSLVGFLQLAPDHFGDIVFGSGADDLILDFAAVKEEQGGNPFDVVLGGRFRVLIHV